MDPLDADEDDPLTILIDPPVPKDACPAVNSISPPAFVPSRPAAFPPVIEIEPPEPDAALEP